MIFIVLILFIAVIVIGLNIHDSNNLEKIRSFLEANKCTQIYYGYGSYKALCQEKIQIVENSFTLDMAQNQKEIKYDTIVNKELKKQKLILTLSNNTQEVLEFKEEKQAFEYDKKLQEKL